MPSLPRTPNASNDPRFTILPDTLKCLKTVSIKTSKAGLYARPSRQAPIETQLLYGHAFEVYKKKQGWLWGQANSPISGSNIAGYVGWIRSRDMEERSIASHIITSLKAPIFSDANIKSPIIMILPLGAHVRAGTYKDEFHQTSLGYIHHRHLTEISAPPFDVDFVAIADRHMGLPYIWGGISSDGLDCSGLVLSALRAIGRDAPRNVDVQEIYLGEKVENDAALKRGDLIFWPGHVGIMRSASDMIHANAHHMCVASEPLAHAIARIGPVRTIKRLT